MCCEIGRSRSLTCSSISALLERTANDTTYLEECVPEGEDGECEQVGAEAWMGSTREGH